jgi:hypothetical protein
MGGLLGTDEQWLAFEADWQARLQDPLPEVGKPALREFKAANCAASDREFRSYNRAERDLVTRYFRDIIIKHKLEAFGVSAPRALWDEMVTGDARAIIGDAEGFCVTMVAHEAFQRAKALGPNADLLLVFDQRPAKFQRRTETILRIYNQHYRDSGVTLFGPNFSPSDRILPLQAADMVAWEGHFEGRRELLAPAEPSRKHLVHYVETGLVQLMTIDRPGLADIVAKVNGPDFKEMAAAFRADLGLT